MSGGPGSGHGGSGAANGALLARVTATAPGA